ncbi:adenylosuccinate synthase [Sphingomonas naasensis]|nr:adenylosuccinate synthetase [Sphingomonas naasensis]NIJ21110.1 adenylosuccinate synthase [Sphingomonas naasensis]
MPIDVVVGGQFGSEGKGKVALWLKRTKRDHTIVVRPGGTNSGHTAYDRDGRRLVLRQLPAACVDGDVEIVFPAGSYIDPEILQRELNLTGIDPALVHIDARAQVILPEHRDAETQSGLVGSIGSTGSGTGAAVMSRIARYAPDHIRGVPIEEHPFLLRFVDDTSARMTRALAAGDGVLVEGTQGFGLSVLHGDSWPKATARDTTAAGFLSESGLPPRGIRDVVMVIRSMPIRVGGDSGPLFGETNWDAVRDDSGSRESVAEFTSVTNRLRRVGHFEAATVKRAIAANDPTMIVLNHLDHIDACVAHDAAMSAKAMRFLEEVETGIGRAIDFIGTGPERLSANVPAGLCL